MMNTFLIVILLFFSCNSVFSSEKKNSYSLFIEEDNTSILMSQNVWEENEKKSFDSVAIISFGGFKWFKEALDNPKHPTMYLQEKKIKDLSDFDQSRIIEPYTYYYHEQENNDQVAVLYSAELTNRIAGYSSGKKEFSISFMNDKWWAGRFRPITDINQLLKLKDLNSRILCRIIRTQFFNLSYNRELGTKSLIQTLYSKGFQCDENFNLVKNNTINENPKKSLPKNKEKNLELVSIGIGSGFLVNNKGNFVTNHHVIEMECQSLKTRYKGKFYQIEDLISDKVNDLAVGRISINKQTEFIPISKGGELGEDIIVSGYPLSNILENSSIKITRGIISSLSGVQNNFSEIQIDAPIQPGNSGGPIVNMYGELVGVSTYTLQPMEDINPQNVNFGKKSEMVQSLLKSNSIKYKKNLKKKTKNSKEIASNLKDTTINLFCENTKSKWVKLSKNQKLSSNVRDLVKKIK